MNAIRLVKNVRQATKADLEATLEYFQGGLALAKMVEEKIKNMPLAVRIALEEKGIDLPVGGLTSIFSMGYQEVMDMMDGM